MNHEVVAGKRRKKVVGPISSSRYRGERASAKKRDKREIARLDFVLQPLDISRQGAKEEGNVSCYYAEDARDLNSRLSRNLCPTQDENQINRPYFKLDTASAQ